MSENHDDWQNPENQNDDTNQDLSWGGSETTPEPEAPVWKIDENIETSETTPAPEQPATSSPIRKKRSGGGVVNVLGWSDVGAIFDFSERFSELEQGRKELFCELFDIQKGSNVIDVAQAISLQANDLSAFNLVDDIVKMVSNGVVGFSDGIRLVTKIDALPDTSAKTIARQISALTGSDIRHRKNGQTTEFVASIFDALDKTKETGRLNQLEEFHELLEVWPGSKK